MQIKYCIALLMWNNAQIDKYIIQFNVMNMSGKMDIK